jgi:2-hydroxy-6-oxonona-2,4-dienedioate hydrolase
MATRRKVLIGVSLAAAVVAAGTAIVWPEFRATIEFHRKRVSSGSVVLNTQFGKVEYAMAGTGPPVLMIHGAGGGYDQAIDNARLLLASGFQVIAPSRFGYLRSSNPPAVTPEMQADTFVVLLDQLNVKRASVIGISAGAVSAV